MKYNKELMNYYSFDNYILYPNECLFNHNNRIHIPPKELSVLTILTENAGKVVGKDFFFQQVWPDEEVNEESLTRCIYSLRKIFKKRFIETIYRKGYLFRAETSFFSAARNTNENKLLAVFPFHYHKETELNTDDVLYRITHILTEQKNSLVSVMPSSVTCDCKNWMDVENIIQQFNPMYYVTGKTFKKLTDFLLILEIVEATQHRLVFQKMFQLTNKPNWINEVCRDIVNFFMTSPEVTFNDIYCSKASNVFSVPPTVKKYEETLL